MPLDKPIVTIHKPDAPSCPVQARAVRDAIPRDERGRPLAFKPMRAATVEESRVPFLILLVFVALSVAYLSLLPVDPYARARAFLNFPVVQVSSRNLVDECGVFMWVRWEGPGFGADAPYIPMRYRY